VKSVDFLGTSTLIDLGTNHITSLSNLHMAGARTEHCLLIYTYKSNTKD